MIEGLREHELPTWLLLALMEIDNYIIAADAKNLTIAECSMEHSVANFDCVNLLLGDFSFCCPAILGLPLGRVSLSALGSIFVSVVLTTGALAFADSFLNVTDEELLL